MRKTLPLLLICLSLLSFSQTQIAHLDYNDSRIKILNGGDFFWDGTTAGYEIPKVDDLNGIKKHTIFSGAIWIGAKDANDKLYMAAMTYRQRGQDFWPGPVSNDTSSRTVYDKIYVVKRSDITEHRSDPSNPTWAILNWPGNGDTTKGEPFQLAPFVDVNSNGIYEPTLGDYPMIKGVAAAYCIYNDQGLHTETGGAALGIEVHQLFYQDNFYVNNEWIRDVNLAKFTVVNRSDRNYKDFVFGVFIDYDLGNYTDDFVGSDPSMDLSFAYNGDDNDEGVSGYGLNPPAQGMMFLNHKMGAAVKYENNTNPINGNPTQAIHYYNYLNAKWQNGMLIEYGGDGITATDGTPARYMYCFDDDTTHPHQSWTEQNSGNIPSDRRLVSAAMPVSLNAGESICYDLAFVYGRTGSGSAVNSVDTMKAKAAIVRTMYDNGSFGWKDDGCYLGSSTNSGARVKNVKALDIDLNIYPNPAKSNVSLVSHNDLEFDYVVYDCKGEGVIRANSSNGESHFTLNGAPGIYVVEIYMDEGHILRKKLILY